MMLRLKQVLIIIIKCGTAAGLDDLAIECVKFAHPCLRALLKEIFEACCKHGCVPEKFCGGRVTTIPKKSKCTWVISGL